MSHGHIPHCIQGFPFEIHSHTEDTGRKLYPVFLLQTTPRSHSCHARRPGSNRKQLMKLVKARILAEDREHCIKHSQSLSIQGQTMHLPLDRAPVLWSTTVTKLPGHVFKFAINAITDTLHQNANLHLWKKSPVSFAPKSRPSHMF